MIKSRKTYDDTDFVAACEVPWIVLLGRFQYENHCWKKTIRMEIILKRRQKHREVPHALQIKKQANDKTTCDKWRELGEEERRARGGKKKKKRSLLLMDRIEAQNAVFEIISPFCQLCWRCFSKDEPHLYMSCFTPVFPVSYYLDVIHISVSDMAANNERAFVAIKPDGIQLWVFFLLSI